MSIVGVEKLVYGSADLAAGIKFHKDWGLDCTRENSDGADFELADGSVVEIRSAGDPSLPPAVIDWAPWGHSTVREAVWGVDTQSSLDQLAAALSGDRDVSVDADGVAHTRDDFGFAIGLAVSRRKPIETPTPNPNNIGHFSRFNEPAVGSRREPPQPLAFSHLVYWLPDDPKQYRNFYLDRLGFRLTDEATDGSAFLRADGRTDHHNLFLQLSRDGYSGFQHVSYELRDFDAVMMAGLAVEAEGWKTNVGPLRHNIGSSLSWYVWNPAGGLAEALTDQDQIGEDWQPRLIDPGDPGFYGHTWVARKEHVGIRPAQWVD